MRHSLLQKTLLQTIRNPGNANLFDGRRWSIRATAKTSTQYTHAYTENILCFGGRSAQRRYRGVASSLPRYVVADQARKGVRESQSTFAISDIRHTGARISTLAVGLGEFYKSWNKASLSEAFCPESHSRRRNTSDYKPLSRVAALCKSIKVSA